MIISLLLSVLILTITHIGSFYCPSIVLCGFLFTDEGNDCSFSCRHLLAFGEVCSHTDVTFNAQRHTWRNKLQTPTEYKSHVRQNSQQYVREYDKKGN